MALIADAFDGIDVRGVVVEDPDDEPAEGWGDGRVFRPEHHAVIGYFPGDRSAAAKRRQLETAVRNLDATAGVRCRITYGEMDEEDWAESWKAFFWPEKISPRLVVKPTWRPYQARADEIVLEIDPGMAFGTGTHPTTRLCLLAMEAHLRKGHRVLDIGTGSGILLVAAAKLGAGRLCGIDTDPVAVDIARENLQRNGVGPDRYALYHGSLAAVKENAFDLMVCEHSFRGDHRPAAGCARRIEKKRALYLFGYHRKERTPGAVPDGGHGL